MISVHRTFLFWFTALSHKGQFDSLINNTMWLLFLATVMLSQSCHLHSFSLECEWTLIDDNQAWMFSKTRVNSNWLVKMLIYKIKVVKLFLTGQLYSWPFNWLSLALSSLSSLSSFFSFASYYYQAAAIRPSALADYLKMSLFIINSDQVKTFLTKPNVVLEHQSLL